MDAEAIQEILCSLAEPEVHELGPEHKFITLPQGSTVRDLRDLMPPPDRVKQRVTLLTVDSFLAYVNRFAVEATTIFANETTGRYDAVIDYHDSATRGTLDHFALYDCPKSDQWTAWVGSSGKYFQQVEFAAFLETNLREITSPPGAKLLQVALELQIHKAAEFESEVRLDNGQTKFRYAETIRGTQKAGDIEIPSAFQLTLAVFVDGAPHKIDARFRYRMNEGKLTLGYELIRHMDVWNAAVKAVTAEIRAGVKDVHVYAGSRA